MDFCKNCWDHNKKYLKSKKNIGFYSDKKLKDKIKNTPTELLNKKELAEKEKYEKYLEKNRIGNQKRSRRPGNRYGLLKRHCKKNKKEITITLEEYKEVCEKPCYYCNNILHEISVTGSNIDRIDSSKGYITGNIVPCCKTCNAFKTNKFTMEETKAAITAILKYRNLI